MDRGQSDYLSYLQGNKDAFSGVLDAYRDNLIFFINRYVKNENIAEEIAADCFVELIVRPKRYNPELPLKNYLFTIAHHKAVNYIRRSKLISFIPISDKVEKSSEYSEFEDEILKNEEVKTIHKALFNLKDDYRTVLHLIYFEKMSYKEAANVMKKTVKQIDNLTSRAKTALRKTLEKEGFSHAK
ncbi:MAG: RNA polymerase sigma factor [Lachnospiraceae bacterium]|nr:RNA polymerase sigma factor [Lachnospiraceae bacterium]